MVVGSAAVGPVSNGKGSQRRGSDAESRRKYEEGWDRIFGKRGVDWREFYRRMKAGYEAEKARIAKAKRRKRREKR